MGVVACIRQEALVLLREDKLRRDLVSGGVARLGDHGCIRRGLRGCGHSAHSSGDDRASSKYGQFPGDTVEKRLPVKWHICVPFFI